MDGSVEFETQIRGFLEDEARLCSMDFGCVIPLYVYRMLGGTVSIEDISAALKEARLSI